MKCNAIRVSISPPGVSLIWKGSTEKDIGDYDNPGICFKNVLFFSAPTLQRKEL